MTADACAVLDPVPDCNALPPDRRAACRRWQGRQLQERWLLTLTWGSPTISPADADWLQCWLGIFPVHWQQLPSPALLQRQLQALHACSSGAFTQLLQAMLLDPALQISLNGPANHRHRPNENLARELLELFTLGDGHYSETDVIEAARALTGYRLNSDQQLELDPRRHDDGLKTVLGRRDHFEAMQLAGWLAAQPATARQIIRRLWRRRIGGTPAPARLEELAQGWREQQLSLPWLATTLQRAPEAAISQRRGLRLADPLEVVARSLRLLGSRHAEAISLSLRGLRAMGQAPFEPPSVKGWPVNEQWISVRWLQARRRTLQQLLAHEEVWASRALPPELPVTLTALPPLGLRLPAAATRENLALLFADPVWQLAQE